MTSQITRPLLAPNQHAMALQSYDCCVFPPQPEWNWDWDWELQLHALAAGDAAALDEATFFQAATGGVESPVSSEASSVYLQDAIGAHWDVDRCSKRQRTAATPPPWRPGPAVVSEDLQCLLEGFWDLAAEGGDLANDLETTITPEMSCSFVSGEDGAGVSGREVQQGQRQRRDPSAQVSAAQGREEAAAAAAAVPTPRRSAMRAGAPLQKATAAAARRDDHCQPVVHCCEPSRAAATTATTLGASCPSALAAAGKETTGSGVLYPFAVVKPLGLDDGCMTTLSDVNQRILKRPARSVRHPVGAFACGPVVTAAHGFGLSGKAVVSLTKIRTGGQGTITIIRTRG